MYHPKECLYINRENEYWDKIQQELTNETTNIRLKNTKDWML